MNDDLTAGEFQAMTGLSPKALRLYGDRGIVAPTAIDPVSGYRRYARSQLRHGMTVDLLRRAQVPLTELAAAADFPFEEWRRTVELRRHLEDFHLDVAEQVAAFDPTDFTAHSEPAPAVDWVGVVVDLDIPEDIEGRVEKFMELGVNTPAIERAFGEALERSGVGRPEVSWSAVPDSAGRNGSRQLLLARPGPARLDQATRDAIAEHVSSSSGEKVVVTSGTLPRRVEVTFSTARTVEPTPVLEAATGDLHMRAVVEAATGYLHVLAFEAHIARHGLRAIRRTARQVVRGPALISGADPSAPVSVFDVHPTPSPEQRA
ncbi:MerR family transcriptional regulator [Myceligenerans pegani]|uniref:HTH merR-type domain-containing protein n=1 Tax=Myceligenerans pegani TaxID=2776917 RepID=A0ABR9MZJ8_9MICO|nr:MerR family transcriptional regulator [Myceligenerans sp. TRM 65318]MBE1876339.1 hypothetical protein [Myceligenerans sp. TRM 65318]MBE3018610.1 hypothetical protein [Myceligenerans sp. TRM 65318]